MTYGRKSEVAVHHLFSLLSHQCQDKRVKITNTNTTTNLPMSMFKCLFFVPVPVSVSVSVGVGRRGGVMWWSDRSFKLWRERLPHPLFLSPLHFSGTPAQYGTVQPAL